MKEKLYNIPKYYDIAFSWDLSYEIKLFRELFKRSVPFKVKCILEPACGTGRFLVSLPKYGYHVTGYDYNPKMVVYANKRIAEAGLHEFAPLKDFGGYGIRFNREMKAYYLRGTRGVLLTTTGGKKYLVGSDHPERLLAVLQAMNANNQ